jgi:hypothetical protein
VILLGDIFFKELYHVGVCDVLNGAAVTSEVHVIMMMALLLLRK